MEETASPPAHTCAHCVDIVFPGSPERIYLTKLGPPEDLFGELYFIEVTRNFLGLSLADLRLGANAGCDFSQYIKDQIEHMIFKRFKDETERKIYKDANPDAIQLYTQLYGFPVDYTGIELLICLQGLHLPHDACEGRDMSRCFVTSRSVSVRYVLTRTLGDNLDGQLMIRKPISRNPLSARTITDVRNWLRNCEDERDGYHKICSLSERAYVPTRLIRISDPLDQLQLELVCGDNMGEHDKSRYVALSYCWGGDQPSKLTQDNYDLYKKNIAWETLPKAVQDAAKTAQALGFHYIWVDSMCIVQDDKKDKETEINLMTKVYAHATLTVVNKRSDRVTEGFLHPRTLSSGTSSIQYRATDGQTQHLTLSEISASIPLDDEGYGLAGYGPLNNKEAESVYRSSFIDAAMFFSVNPGYRSGQLDEELVRTSWYAIVESYSLRSVTESEDRVLALSGIAERFASLIPGRYIAGLWENMMPRSLFWMKPILDMATDRPVEYRGPSWSWISIDGQVELEHIRIDNCLCEIVSVEYMLENAEALYGAVRNATLHIKGPALSVEWRCTRQDWRPLEDPSEFRWHRGESDKHQDPDLGVRLDAREPTTEWREVVLLAYGFSNEGPHHRYTRFIALTKVDEVEVDNEPRHRFRRLGIGSFMPNSPLPHVESWPVSSYYVI
ncbi:unnamed protein product [Alternaria alternata]